MHCDPLQYQRKRTALCNVSKVNPVPQQVSQQTASEAKYLDVSAENLDVTRCRKLNLNRLKQCTSWLPSSVVSTEISGGKFPEIYSNLSGNFRFRKCANCVYQSAVSKSSIAK